MRTSDTIKELATALSKAQAIMRPASKDSENPHFKSKYSDMASIMEAVREPLASNGLTVWQDASTNELGVSILTRVVHISGEWVEFGPFTVPVGRKDAHGIGSATSYAKRYALSAALGVVSDEDDDGNKAMESVARMAQPKKASNFIQELKSIDPMQKITENQTEELRAILRECSPEYQATFRDGLAKIKCDSLADISVKNFLEIKKKLSANREMYQALKGGENAASDS